MHYIDAKFGTYYEGDQIDAADVAVAERPSPSHALDNDTWVLDYDHASAAAVLDINTAAGEARARYITVAIGQEATYLLKEHQAREFKAAGYPPGNVPSMVQAEMDAFGTDAQTAADVVIATADNWIALAATIERIRRQSTAQIDTAITNDDGQAVIEALRDAALTALAAI